MENNIIEITSGNLKGKYNLEIINVFLLNKIYNKVMKGYYPYLRKDISKLELARHRKFYKMTDKLPECEIGEPVIVNFPSRYQVSDYNGKLATVKNIQPHFGWYEYVYEIHIAEVNAFVSARMKHIVKPLNGYLYGK